MSPIAWMPQFYSVLMDVSVLATAMIIALASKRDAHGQDMYRKPHVYKVPGMDAVEVHRDIAYKTADNADLKMDIYLPPGRAPGARLPVIFFIHGGYIPRNTTFLPKEWGVYQSYGRLAAASGLAGVTFNYRYWGWSREDMERSFGDVLDAIRFVRSQAAEYSVDAERVALWAFSGGGPHLAIPLREKLDFVRCLVSFYAILDLSLQTRWAKLDAEKEKSAEFSPVTYLRKDGPKFPPVFIGRAGHDSPVINGAVDRFVAQALALNQMIELMNHPEGRHGFDILNDDSRSREIIARALEFIKAHI